MTNAPEFPEELRLALRIAAQAPRLLVASDFDGTISPIVSNPSDARPIPSAAKALSELAGLPQTASALISGRSLHDLGILSGAPSGVQLVGSHGSEFSADFVDSIDDPAKATLRKVVESLQTVAARYPGAVVETKPVSAAFHVRNVDQELAARALEDASSSVRGLEVYPTEGKAVREFAVIETNKGVAVELLSGDHNASVTVYFGDDVTDEKAFERLDQSRDVGVKVGHGPTRAQYRIQSPDEVALALEFLYGERRSLLNTAFT